MAINKNSPSLPQSAGLNIAPIEVQRLHGLGLNIALAEFKFICLVTFLLLVVTSIPDLYGYLTTPGDRWFSGIVDNVHDTAQYLSWMRESGTRLFIENKLTSEPSGAIFLNLHWWIPGRLALVLGLTLPQMYQVLRLLSISLLTVVTYAFCTLLFEDLVKRRFAFLLCILTSGLGWIWVVKKQLTGQLDFPRDVQTTLGNSFYTMMSSPHLAFAAALTLLVLLLALQGVRLSRPSLSVAAGFLGLFLGMGHVYDLVTVWAVLGVFGLLMTLRDQWSWRTFRGLCVVVLISAPAVLYFAWVSSDANPTWKQALAQYDNLGVFTPDPLHLILLLGLTFLVASATFEGVVPLRNQSSRALFIKGWFGITLLLIYLPLQFQIMLLTGYQLPIAALATIGLFDRILPWLQERLSSNRLTHWLSRERLRYWMPALFLLAVIPTNLYLLSWRVVDLNRHDYPFYLYRDDVAAMQWLATHTDPNTVVLSSFVIGHYVPGLAGNRAFLSNAVMTMDFNQKRTMVDRFFNAATADGERLVLVRRYGIHYVFYGEAERSVGAYDPAASSLFSEVFTSPRAKIYKVRD